MNRRAVVMQLMIFTIQWGLMLAGFGILSELVAPIEIVETSLPYGNYVDGGVKALLALALSIVWLFLWDRQVRFLFYRRHRQSKAFK